MPAQNPRKTGAKLPGDFADIQVRNCLSPHDFLVVSLVVSGHALARMTCDFLPILSGFLVQVERQRSNLVEARHLFFLPSLVAFRCVSGVLERSSQIPLFNLRPVVLGLRLLLFEAIRFAVDQVRRDNIVTAPTDDCLEFRRHPKANPCRVTGLGRFLLHHVQVALSDAVEPHVEDVCPALRGDQGQVDRVLQPGWRLLPDGLQPLHGVTLAQFLLDPVDRARRRVVRAQSFGSGVVEYVCQQRTALVRRARRKCIQHFGDHANRDLVDGLAFELLAEAPEVHRV